MAIPVRRHFVAAFVYVLIFSKAPIYITIILALAILAIAAVTLQPERVLKERPEPADQSP